MLAYQSALALENARLLAAEKAQRAVAEALKETAVAINAARTLDEVLDAIIAHLESFIPHDARDVMLIEGDIIKTVRAAGQIDVDYEAWCKNLILSMPETINAQQMIAHRRPHYIPDVTVDDTWTPYPETAWVRAIITAPILMQETAVGFINLYNTTPNSFTQEQANLLAGFAEQVATGLEKVQLIEQLRRQNEYLEEQVAARTRSLQHQYQRQAALAQIELVISEAQELRDVLRKIAMLLHEQLPVSKGASVILWDEEAEQFTISASTVPGQDERLASKRVRRRGGATRWIVDNKKPVIVPDINEDPFGANQMLGEYKSYAYAGVPVLDGQRVLGVLYALESHPKQYTQEEIEFMQLLASRAAIAIVKVRLYEQLKETNKLLEERKAELEARNRELETFTYSVSHDLKAPLRGIDGYSRLLLEDYADKLDEDGRFFLTTIRKATMQMTELIEDLLLYSRLERRALQHEQMLVNELVEALLYERVEEIESRGVDLQVSVPETAVLADKDGLSMALRNLIDNALKFTQHQDTPLIEVGGRETEKTCIIWVSDNGVGFDMKFHQRIFEIFQRLHRVEDYPGTGIGLALVQKAMERMNGRVWAESAPGKGATFYLEIPKP
jgi:signal transduction histidine kinase